MATFRFGRDVNMKWNGNEIVGPAGTIFRIEDAYYDEFNNSVGHAEPTLEWLVTNELAVVQANVAGLPVSATLPITATTSTSGTNIALSAGTSPSGYVLTSNGSGSAAFAAATGGGAAGVSSITGTAPIAASASTGAVTLSLNANYATSNHDHAGTYQVAGDYSTSTHTHTSFANNLQINKADSKVQLLNTTSGSGTEDGMYLLMADTDVGYLWNAETNGALVLGTGGAERARITPAGKFGIGTNAPAHQLEVAGPQSVTVGIKAGGAGFAELELNGNDGINYITSDDTLSFDVVGAERARITSSGLDVTSGTLSQGGTAVSLSTHTHAYQPAGTYVTAVNGTAPITASTSTAGIVSVSLSATYSSSTHDHSGVYQVAGNYATNTHTHPLPPTGSIVMWPTVTAPTGWLFLDGSTYSQATYPDLAAVFGVVSGTFTLPDMRDRFAAGASTVSALANNAGTFAPNTANATAHDHTTNIAHAHADTIAVSTHADHTHNTDPAATTSGAPSATFNLAYSGGATNVSIPTTTHTHSTNIASTASGAETSNLTHTVTGGVTSLGATSVTSSSEGGTLTPKATLLNFIIKT